MQSVPGLFIEAVYVVCEWRCLGLCEPVSAVRFMNIATFNDKCLVGYFISAPRPVLEKLKEFMDGNFYTLVSGINIFSGENMNHIFPNRCVAVVCQVVSLGYVPSGAAPKYAYKGRSHGSCVGALASHHHSGCVSAPASTM